jgi:hypothetical protein
MTKTNLAPLRACVLQARAINAQVHVAQHSHDWPTGECASFPQETECHE